HGATGRNRGKHPKILPPTEPSGETVEPAPSDPSTEPTGDAEFDPGMPFMLLDLDGLAYSMQMDKAQIPIEYSSFNA
ncbi:hypothetical protein EVA_22208, partial [gut metagenome]